MRPQERIDRLARARLYLCCGDRPDLEGFLESVLAAGVDVLQLREKQMETRPLLRLAERFRDACERNAALFILNDRPDLAAAAGADGVHLGQEDLPPDAARDLLGPEALIGRSTHTSGEIRTARDEPVDYIAVGPVHATPTKPGRPAVGLDLVRLAAGEATIPWFAIGGIDPSNVEAVAAAGARRIAVVRALTDAADAAAAAVRLRTALGASAPRPDAVRRPRDGGG